MIITAWVVVAVLAAAVIAGGSWLDHWRRTRVLVTVDGDSMSPTFHDGQRLLLRRTRTAKLETGTVVAIAPTRADGSTDREGRLWLVKRVAAAPGDPIPTGVPALANRAGEPVPAGFMVILGDNPAHSHDSRQEGLIDIARLRGVLLRSFDD